VVLDWEEGGGVSQASEVKPGAIAAPKKFFAHRAFPALTY
jgi:hypothetical protein